MKDGELFYSYLPEPWRVLGLELRPLSLGHLILLHRIESAFVVGGIDLDYNDLAASVFICACTFQRAIDALSDNRRHQKWLRKWQRKVGSFDFDEKCKLFADYLKEGCWTPTYQFPESNARSLDCPDIQVVKVTLMSRMGFTEAELLDRSWRLCSLDYLTLKAIDGQIAFADDDALEEARKVGEALMNRLKQNGHTTGTTS